MLDGSVPKLQEAAAHVVFVVEAVDKVLFALGRLHFATFESRSGDRS